MLLRTRQQKQESSKLASQRQKAEAAARTAAYKSDNFTMTANQNVDKEIDVYDHYTAQSQAAIDDFNRRFFRS